MSGFIRKLLPIDELSSTVKRFPLSVLCAVILFVLAFALNHGIGGFDQDLLGRFVAILGCLYFWFGVTKLISEGQKLGFVAQSLLSLVGGVGIILLIGTSTLWGMHLLFIIPALLLALMFAPYLTSGDDTSFWFFNRQMWFGVVVSYAALILFAGGLSAALVAINILFGLSFGGSLFADIWLFASLVLGPIYALSWVPKKFEFTPEDCNDPPGLQFIVNWISAPMIFVYMAILYAYFGKIIITGDMPEGYLAMLITVFIGAGVVTYLVAWPMRESGSLQLRAFYKIFFLAMIVPVGFHFYAVWERISAYGITEQRYFLLLSAVWFATIAIGNVIARMPIKVIPASLCILMALASFGPWGAISLSGHSQYSRLVKLMDKNQLLDNGQAIAARETVASEDRISISSIIKYLCQTERDDMLRSMFEFEKNCSAYSLTKTLGFDFVHYRHNNRNYGQKSDDRGINFNRSRKYEKHAFVDIQHYDFLIKNISLKSPWVTHEEAYKKWNVAKTTENGDVISFSYNMPDLTISYSSGEVMQIEASFNLTDYANKNVSMVEKDDELSDIVFENDRIAIRLDVSRLNGKAKDGDHVVTFMGFDFYYRLKR